MSLKTYTISTDITAGEVDVKKLSKEISDSGHVTGFDGLHKTGDTLNLMGDSFSNESACDTIVQDHVMVSLLEYKALKNVTIDVKTAELIQAGGSYDSKLFSLTIGAQLRHCDIAWRIEKGDMIEGDFPIDISTIDNLTYSLTWANVQGFLEAMRSDKDGHLNSGNALKKSINDAADETAVDAITDTR